MKVNVKKYRQRKGFSLVEIVIAIAVIGIMAAATVPLIKTTMDKARKSRADSEMEAFVNAATSMFSDTARVPAQISCAGSAPGAVQNVDGDVDAAVRGVSSVTPGIRALLTVTGTDDSGVGAGVLVNGELLDLDSNLSGVAMWEDMDRHFGVGVPAAADCTKTVRNYDDKERDLYWKGPYLSPQDRRDPWGKSYIMLAPVTTDVNTKDQKLSFTPTRPGWILSAGGEEGFLETGLTADSIDYNPDDVGKKIVLR